MKLLFFLAVVLAGLVPLAAQVTNAPSTGGQHGHAMIGFLSQADQDRVMNAYNKAIAADPSLQAEGDVIIQQAQQIKDATPKDRQALMEKVRTHRQKIRKAMLKQDPTLAPVLDQIDKHASEMRAKQAKSSGAGQ